MGLPYSYHAGSEEEVKLTKKKSERYFEKGEGRTA